MLNEATHALSPAHVVQDDSFSHWAPSQREWLAILAHTLFVRSSGCPDLAQQALTVLEATRDCADRLATSLAQEEDDELVRSGILSYCARHEELVSLVGQLPKGIAPP